jgi:hypothetical protein
VAAKKEKERVAKKAKKNNFLAEKNKKPKEPNLDELMAEFADELGL